MSNWLKLSILATVVFAFLTATARAESWDVKYSESFSGNWKKVGTGEEADVTLFKSGRFALQGSFKLDEAATFDVTSVFSVELWAYDVTSTVPVYSFSCVLNEFAAAFGENSSDKGVNYTADKRSAKAVKVVTYTVNEKEKTAVVETVTFSHGKDKKSVNFTVTGTLVNVGTNTAPSYTGTLAAIDPNADDDDGGVIDPGTWMYVECGFDLADTAKGSGGLGSSLPVDGTRAAKNSSIKLGEYPETYFNPSLNLKGSAKGSYTETP